MHAASALLATRLAQQQLTAPTMATAETVVAHLGAVQAQDFTGAVWAVGMRARGLTENAVHRTFDDGRLLRTHVMRPTWHFVTPADIRWLLTLTAPRVHAIGASYLRKAELTPRVLARCHRAIEKALAGGRFLTRAELGAHLQRAGITATGARLGLVMMNAELEALVCSGPLRGRQFTYALLDERVPRTPARTRAEALKELATRYFTSHGPATMRDLAWWSGLALRDVKEAVVLAGSLLAASTVDGITYWSPASCSLATTGPAGTYLLPNYDEFLIAYKDRGLSVLPGTGTAASNPIFAHQVVVDGRVVGSWRRDITPRRACVDVLLYQGPPSAAMQRRIRTAASALGLFLERPVELSVR